MNATLDDLVKRSPSWVSFDQKRLFIDREFLASFESRGWTSLARIHHAGDAEEVRVFRRLPERENARASLGYSGNVYLKRHFHDPQAGLDEARAILICTELGIKTARLIAFGSNAETQASLVMTQALDDHRPANQIWHQLDATRRESLFCEMATLTQHLHLQQLFHRDLYWCHFFVRESGMGELDVRIIDLQRLFQPSTRPWRWRIKDLGQFLYSAPSELHRPRNLHRWWQVYRGKARLDFSDHLLLRSVQARAWAYRMKEGAA